MSGKPRTLPEIDGVLHKRCSLCKELKPVSEFYSLHRSGHGLYNNTCKACDKQKAIERRDKIEERGYINVEYKMCSRCGQTKPIDSFGIGRSNNDGHNSWCKLCVKEYCKSRYKPKPPRVSAIDYSEDGTPIGRTCTKCGQYKPARDFSTVRNNKLNSWCHQCVSLIEKSKRHYSERTLLERDGRKRCPKCHEIKPLSDFSSRGEGHLGKCKQCANRKMQEWRRIHRGLPEIKAREDGLRKARRDKFIAEHPPKKKYIKPSIMNACSVCQSHRRMYSNTMCIYCHREIIAEVRAKIKLQARHSKRVRNPVVRRPRPANIQCLACGEFKTDNSGKYCKKCRDVLYRLRHKERCLADDDYHRSYNQKLYDNSKKWRANNPDKNRAILDAKYRKRSARKRGAEGSFTSTELKQLFSDCGNQCLKCGSCDNLTIDHVVPIVLGGTNYLVNIQPLCRPCNSSKSHYEIIDYRWKIFNSLNIDTSKPQWSDGKFYEHVNQ